jgi:hypothetical protein
VTGSRRSGAVALLALALALVAVVLGGRATLVRGGDGGDPARLRALEARVAFLEARLRRLPGGPEIASTASHLTLPAPSPSAPTAAGEEGTGPLRRIATKAAAVDEVALQQSYFSELDARLASETRDPLWSAPTEELLRGSAHELRPRISVEAAQCGSSMCRVETSVEDPQEEARALDKFLSATVALLPDAVVREGAQPGRRIVYFSRKSGDFPPMAAEPESATP